MSRIAIMAAMHEELHTLLALMPDEQRHLLGGREFWVGRLQGREVVVVLSRIGKVAAATTATLLATHFDVRELLFTGVAGGLGEGVRVGDVVVADLLLQHDLDASPLFPRYEVPLYGRSRFATDARLNRALQEAAEVVLGASATHLGEAAVQAFGLGKARVHGGLVISGDQFVASAAQSGALRAALPDALAVEMEGAAVAQVCHDLGVPCAVVRTISDRADDTAERDFGAFVREVASHYSSAIVLRYLQGG
ncbi:5'-methylthioadenosine/adenosylhomocysteine nucleosidase [Caldimonas brevitalea]|uniref:adenosylhomocysteine nucleosidase n=1 Tax=Caldimonas brevitalea TaxID=413882 RepID=A0A0G3BG05_9BURK|nr:5'-methylthioadenosine/adenosylhomocysteine nucleosidase [Caldimonas brevitalea]AKJ26888.1 S-adenosylhomocysteine nucleosidase [Caldimonas brevitalea]